MSIMKWLLEIAKVWGNLSYLSSVPLITWLLYKPLKEALPHPSGREKGGKGRTGGTAKLDCYLSDPEIDREGSAYSPGWQHEAALLVSRAGLASASGTLTLRLSMAGQGPWQWLIPFPTPLVPFRGGGLKRGHSPPISENTARRELHHHSAAGSED